MNSSPSRSASSLAMACLYLSVLTTHFSSTIACAADQSVRSIAKPNIVYIMADDLGPTDVGCYGSKYYETPHIDRLAVEGMKFTDGYTCGPNCQPTRAALMSGQYGPRTGIYTVGGTDRFDWSKRPLIPVSNVTALPTGKITVAESLRTAGYKTGMFGKWHLGEQPGNHPKDQGFDEAIVSDGAHVNFRTNPKVEIPKNAYLADFLTDRAVDFIERHRDEPFYLYLPHFGVHSPFQAKAELIVKFENKPGVGGHNDPTYAAMVASVDESVGRIIAKLDELKLSENTLVVFTSDNGGVGGYQREGIAGKGVTDNLPFRGGKGMLYEGGVRCAYLFRRPGTIQPGAVCREPICTVDFYPTALELAGAAKPEKQVLDGVSYWPLLTGDGSTKLARDAIYWHFPGYLGSGNDTWRTTPVGAIRSGEYKLLEFFEDGRLELYHLSDDVGQKQNLATAQPEKTKELHDKLVAWRTAIKAPMPQRQVANDATPPPTVKKSKAKKKASS
jgi:arylsulfatase A-like enzyme